jgi:thiamine phosphate synthase YjbQ (UPF0047 family)
MIYLKNYYITTVEDTDVRSVVHEVERTIRESGAKSGLATVIVPESGAALVIGEPLDDFVTALKDAVLRMQGTGSSTKNRRKEEIDLGPRLASAILGRSLQLPFEDGHLLLGVREEPLIIDLNRAAHRLEFRVQVMGEGGEDKDKRPPPPRRE